MTRTKLIFSKLKGLTLPKLTDTNPQYGWYLRYDGPTRGFFLMADGVRVAFVPLSASERKALDHVEHGDTFSIARGC